jgi:hypothetical protein
MEQTVTAFPKVIGLRTRYTGTEHPYLREHEVEVVGVLKGAMLNNGEEYGYLTDDEAIAAAGGVTCQDRIDVAPVLGDRLSFATSDARATDLEVFVHLKSVSQQPEGEPR